MACLNFSWSYSNSPLNRFVSTVHRGQGAAEYPRIVVWLNPVREPLDDRPEGDHTAVLVALLVLRDRELDVAEDKVWFEVSRLFVVRNRLVEVVHDEGDYSV